MSKDKRGDKINLSDFLSDLEKKVKSRERSRTVKEEKSTKENKNSNEGGSNNKEPKKVDFFAVLVFIAVFAGLAFLLFSPSQSGDSSIAKVSYSRFVSGVEEGKISRVEIVNGEKVNFQIDNLKYTTDIPYPDQDLMKLLLSHGVDVSSKIVKDSFYLQAFLNTILPFLLIMFVIYFFFVRPARNGKGIGGGFNFGKVKSKVITQDMVKERFVDVQGCDEAKSELEEVVAFLKTPKKYLDIGAKIPKGVLLVGPPGNGKTLLARAVAGEAGVPFLAVSGSDFVEMFVGVGASRVRDLFENARRSNPCIVFIDEIDAVGRTRGVGHGGGNDEREQTLNQLLVELDGFDTHEGMIVLAATNRVDVLDKALLRPGRFDKQVFVDLPDVRGRRKILDIHAKNIKLSGEVDMDRVARSTPGFSGADLANLLNEAALIAAKKGKKEVDMVCLDDARDKILMGPERSSMLMDEEEKKMTAYHEAGHALVGMLLKHTKQLHKISIIPRGRALGLTSFLPDDGKHSYSKQELINEVMINFGGRAAEEIIFGEVSTGASNDIKVATKIVRSMVKQFGMSALGMVSYSSQKPYLMSEDPDDQYSEEFAKKIDEEISKTSNGLYEDTVALLKQRKNKTLLEKLSKYLLEKEVLDVVEVYEYLKLPLPPKVVL